MNGIAIPQFTAAAVNQGPSTKAEAKTGPSGFGMLLAGAAGSVHPVQETAEGMGQLKELFAAILNILQNASEPGENAGKIDSETSLDFEVLNNGEADVVIRLADALKSLSNKETAGMAQDDEEVNSDDAEAVLANMLGLLQQLEELNPKQWLSLNQEDVTSAVRFIKQLVSSIGEQTPDMQAEPDRDLSSRNLEADQLGKELKQQLDSFGESIKKQSNELSGMAAEKPKLSNVQLDILRTAYSKASEEADTGRVETASAAKGESSQEQSLPFQMTKLEQFVISAGKNGSQVSEADFIRQFEAVLSKAKLSESNGIQKLMIKLNPENLGSIKIEISRTDNGITARIIASSTKGKELMETHLDGMKQSFTGLGLQVDKVEVAQQSAFQAERFSFRDGGTGGGEHNQPEQEQQEEQPSGEFDDSFEEALLNIKI